MPSVKEETAAALAETIRSSTSRATTALEARGAEAMQEVVWVRREPPPLLAEPACEAAAAAEKRGVEERARGGGPNALGQPLARRQAHAETR